MCFFATLQNAAKVSWPTEGIENFWERLYLYTIKHEGRIYTACGDGKTPFVSATDIAAVAFHALTDNTLQETDDRVLGPELLTYDEVYGLLGLQFNVNAEADTFHADRGQVHQRLGTQD